MVTMHKVTALFLLSPCKQTEMWKSVNPYRGDIFSWEQPLPSDSEPLAS